MPGSRLRNDVGLMMRHKSKSALEILGSLDDLKFRSCLTLFAQAALGNSERGVFNEALDQFYGGEPDKEARRIANILDRATNDILGT